MTYVVHLEDDETLQEILKVAFQATDPKVNLKQFINGDDAFGHIQPNLEAIDLFVLDIRVPGSIDGIGVARKIRELGCDAPIIMTSAYRQPEREVVDSLGLEWMSKPWHIMEISQRLITLARNRRAKATQAAAAVTAEPAASATTPPPAPAAPPVQTAPPPPPPTVRPPEPEPVVPSTPITPSIKPQLTAAPPPPPAVPVAPVTPPIPPKPEEKKADIS